MPEVTASVDDRGRVSWNIPPDSSSRAAAYAEAAHRAEAELGAAESGFVIALRAAGVAGLAAEAVGSMFCETWGKLDARAIGDENKEAHAADRDTIRMIATEIERKHPVQARRAKLFSELSRRGFERVDARALATDALPENSGGPLAGVPWKALDAAGMDEQPKSAPAIGRGLLAFGPAGVTSIVSAGKRGKSTAVWSDLAPVTAHGGTVLAIVGRAEKGAGGNHDYARIVYGAGGDPARVSTVEPAPGLLLQLDRLLPSSGFACVVVDSTASLCAAEGVNENDGQEVRGLIETHVRSWGCPVVLVRHSVNAGINPALRDPSASRGAGSRDWLAAVDGEATLMRELECDTSLLVWAGREGLPAATGFRLDKGVWPWRVEVLDGADLPTNGGGDPGAGVAEEAAERAVLDVLDKTTEKQPYLMKDLRHGLANRTGQKMDSGQAFRPYRDAIDRLFGMGNLGADSDPRERKTGRRLNLWKLGKSEVSEVALRTSDNGDRIPRRGIISLSKGSEPSDFEGKASAMNETNERACQFEGCTSSGLPRHGLMVVGDADDTPPRVCAEHWIAWQAETAEVPSEPAPPSGCTNEAFRGWLDRVEWRPATEAEVAAEHARLMSEHNRGAIH